MPDSRSPAWPDAGALVARIAALGREENRAGMARFGIDVRDACGTPVSALRPLAREAGRSHRLAAELWASGVHEARILASMVDVPAEVTMEQMDAWAKDFTSWDLCDQCCNKLFRRTAHAWNRAFAWSRAETEFVKRAGFTLMAVLAVHDRKAADDAFRACLGRVAEEAGDERPYVRKAVNWALRQIGKRNAALLLEARAVAAACAASARPSTRWIGCDALREFDRRKLRS